MVRTSDGFEIAEADLRLREPGDIEGTQQSGIVDLKIADIVKDEKMLKYARTIAIDLFTTDPNLAQNDNFRIREYLRYIDMRKPGFASIS